MTRQKSSYYGPFFWVSLVSFAVPLFVAWSAFSEVGPTTKPVPRPDASGVDHDLWDYLLKTYVENGLVDYNGIERDHLFRTYLRQLGQCDLSKLTTSSDRLAMMCNAYNAFVINGVVTHRITDNVLNYKVGETGFFDLPEHILAGKTVSLNHIEHNVIRKAFAEPRIHVALVCAAKSCPAIRPEAYVGSRIEKQLADQSQLFANNPKYVSIAPSSGQVQINPILQWYGDDWKNDGGFLAWLQEETNDEDLKQALARTIDGQIAIKWNVYDWSLNSQGSRSSGGGAAHSGFGSGSVPNE